MEEENRNGGEQWGKKLVLFLTTIPIGGAQNVAISKVHGFSVVPEPRRRILFKFSQSVKTAGETPAPQCSACLPYFHWRFEGSNAVGIGNTRESQSCLRR